MNQPTIPVEEQSTIFLNGKQLAEVLDVSPPTLSEAVRQGYNCAGHPVEEWVERSNKGHVKGYHVPGFLVAERGNPTKKEPQEAENHPNEANIRPNEGQKPVNKDPYVIRHNYSLLPEGEDYVRPIGMIGLNTVVAKAIEYDTPQGRTVIAIGSTGIGAILGHAVTDSSSGAGIGALAGLGITAFCYWYYGSSNISEIKSHQIAEMFKDRKPDSITQNKQGSQFLPN